MGHLIDQQTYFDSIRDFVNELHTIHQEKQFDSICTPKRSGLFPGVWASHKLHLPIFVPSELRKMTLERFTNVLVLDIVVWHGRTLRKVVNQLAPRQCFTACVWRESSIGEADFILYKDVTGILDFFYDRNGDK